MEKSLNGYYDLVVPCIVPGAKVNCPQVKSLILRDSSGWGACALLQAAN